jgi:prophage regulatory protein
MATKILRLPDVLQHCGLSRSSLYAQVAEGKFPKPVKISTRSVGWVESDLNDWVQSRIKDATQRSHHVASCNGRRELTVTQQYNNRRI